MRGKPSNYVRFQRQRLASQLKAAAEKLGFSYKEVAILLGCCHESVRRWYMGVEQPARLHLVKGIKEIIAAADISDEDSYAKINLQNRLKGRVRKVSVPEGKAVPPPATNGTSPIDPATWWLLAHKLEQREWVTVFNAVKEGK